ncbi:hypothetical protein GUJ93_ZPchr0005g16078 [Zizania palustris]|uniref:Uncharacterized protein n=1 Tax=Zizania palustris TaxID=103762 RepID=A0A8J5S494_ZIZPA|nr:hypothetical protein GUJ93_ZPchr0005g16078 [Zizania palustris]
MFVVRRHGGGVTAHTEVAWHQRRGHGRAVWLTRAVQARRGEGVGGVSGGMASMRACGHGRGAAYGVGCGVARCDVTLRDAAHSRELELGRTPCAAGAVGRA